MTISKIILSSFKNQSPETGDYKNKDPRGGKEKEKERGNGGRKGKVGRGKRGNWIDREEEK